ncbi:MAG: hemerythrin domain-containing protein [Pseudomonadaceae bacterium]|nr:hemerythrin domain-containing protein [Pseudomonadaceae bacterium]
MASKENIQTQLMDRLNNDHFHIATVMNALEKMFAGFPDEDIDWSEVSDMLSYLQEYPDSVHHPLEDQLFDRVLDKGLTPVERELVHTNLAQHAEIISATLRLDQDVNQILNDTVVPIGKVLEDFEHYIQLQRTHMRNENTHLFPLAQRLLTPEDWRDVAADYASHVDPMLDLKQGRFASLFEYITER